jgi:hypothetical protein
MSLSVLVVSGEDIAKADVNEMISALTTIASSVKFSPAYNPTYSNVGNTPREVTIDELQTIVNNFEKKFSNNCNCLTNTDCNQTCQNVVQCTISQCTNQSYYNQSSGNQTCQSTSDCTKSNQSCQSNQD